MKDRQYKVWAAIGDLHIGNRNIPAKTMKQQLRKHFFDVLDKCSVLDGIFVLGDVSHQILSLNSDYSELYLWFWVKLYKLAKRKGATVIALRGTASHECDHASNIMYLVQDGIEEGVDFRYYDTYDTKS